MGMTRSDSRPDLRPEHPLEPAECWHRLQTTECALLHYASGCGHRAVATAFAVDDGGVLVRLPDVNPACHYVDGREVMIELDEADPDHRWTVQLSGVARVRDESPLPWPDDGWPAATAGHTFFIPATRLNGTEVDLATN